MIKFIIPEALTYDDVLLVPQYSEVSSRSLVDISVDLGDLKFSHPVIPANMKTITGIKMAHEIVKSGGLAILHRFMSVEDQIAISKEIIKNYGSNYFAVSVGVKEEDLENISKFVGVGVKIFCIDIAHGDSLACINTIKYIKKYQENSSNNKLYVIAGNVATGAGAERLWEAGADMVKVGVGPGSLCSTRVETGNGVPQLTALMEVSKVQKQLQEKYNRKFAFIADGGIKSAGDVVKALCFADMVMVGNMFAGCLETPGQILSIDGKSYKEYVGSSTHKTNHVEGVAAMVPVKSNYKEILQKISEGLKSGCSYQGVSNLQDLKENHYFVRITSAGLKESHPHSI